MFHLNEFLIWYIQIQMACVALDVARNKQSNNKTTLPKRLMSPSV